jgi:hypothetical protein
LVTASVRVRGVTPDLSTGSATVGWPFAFGSTTNVLLFDGDAFNHFTPSLCLLCPSRR